MPTDVNIFNVHRVQQDRAKCPPPRYIRALRSLNFLVGVLKGQKNDPLCPNCTSYMAMVKLAKDSAHELFEAFKQWQLPEKLKDMYKAVKDGIEEIEVPDYPVAQKKAGNCKLPEGVCFSKTGLEAFLKDILDLKE